MKVKQIRVRNYKGIRDSGVIELGDGFNVIVGQNNVGKTALLERFAFTQSQNKPYRSASEDPFYVPDRYSRTDIELQITGRELSWMIRTNDSNVVLLPLVGLSIRSHDDFRLWVNGTEFGKVTWRTPLFLNGDQWRNPEGNTTRSAQLCASQDGQSIELLGFADEPANALPNFIGTRLKSFSYVFKAERLNVGASGLQSNLELDPSAGNLAGALNQLRGEKPALFDQLLKTVSLILPTVKHVSIVASSTNTSQVAIQVWNDPPDLTSSATGRPLSDCGTGVGQILAILYVVMTSPFGRTIVIDEPNSFLHPSATRARSEAS